MIKVKVKTVWQGKVGINEKYVREAIASGEGLEIWVGAEVLQVKPEDVRGKILMRSDKPFRDRFGKTPPYYLVYYEWKPTIAQGTLL